MNDKPYKDSDGEEANIHQMVSREPIWAANRIEDLEVENKAYKEAMEGYKKDCAEYEEIIDGLNRQLKPWLKED